jgi:hypothetical protein
MGFAKRFLRQYPKLLPAFKDVVLTNAGLKDIQDDDELAGILREHWPKLFAGPKQATSQLGSTLVGPSI